ncbi:MAG: hypothetical protein LIP23_05905 [Planctomycetes bacterium]|nr:hypothetical protein [Planctomycetota bacterium]
MEQSERDGVQTTAPVQAEEVIEAERIGPADGGFNRGPLGEMPQTPPEFRSIVMPRAPIFSTWLCLLIAWFFFASQTLFSVFLAIPFNIAAIVLALVCMTRLAVFTGIIVLFLATVGSLAIYIVSLVFFVGGAAFS